MSLSNEGNVPELVVTDSGSGIPPDELNRIFDEFHRIGGAASADVEGSGLGLAIVARLCQLLKFRISVDSDVGEGSSFRLQLHSMPASDSMDGPGIGIDDWVGTLDSNKRILVVDDDASIREAMKASIEVMGAEVVTVDSIDTLREVLNSGSGMPVSAIIADYRLQDSDDGFEAIRLTRERLGSLPAAIITGDMEFPVTTRIVDQAIPIFRKPVSQSTIGNWLTTVLN